MKIQRKIIGRRRTPMSSALAQEIKKRIVAESVRYGVSKSFVIANACAFAFGIPTESYITEGAKNVVKFKRRAKAS